MSLRMTLRPLASLALILPLGWGLAACGSDGEQVALSPAQLESALLTQAELPLAEAVQLGLNSQEDVSISSERMVLAGTEMNGASEDCRAAFSSVYPEEGIPTNTAIGDYVAAERYLTTTLMSFQNDAGSDLAEGFNAVGSACEGQTLTDSSGFGLTIEQLDNDALDGFVMRLAEGPEGFEGDLSVFDTHLVVSQRGNNSVNLMGMGLTEDQIAAVLTEQTDKLAAGIDRG